MSTSKSINIWSLITANHNVSCLYLCAQFYGYVSLADETVVFYLKSHAFAVRLMDLDPFSGVTSIFH